MGSLLIEAWLDAFDPGAVPVEVVDDAAVSVAREHVRRRGAGAGLAGTALEELVAATSELAQNQLAHAGRGVIAVRPIDGGVEILAADAGPGIADLEAALADAPRPAGAPSLGIGLAAARRMVDELDLDVRLGEGTCVRARKRSAPGPKGIELGVYGRPCEGERASGDDAAIVRTGGVIAIALADGLGHGPEARDPARACVAVLAELRDAACDALLLEAHARLGPTRGAVATCARLEAGGIEVAGAGNVQAMLVEPRARATKRFGGRPFTLGSGPRKPPAFHVDRSPFDRGDTLVLYTDGIFARSDPSMEAVANEHPAIVAQRIVSRHARADDDALVIVAR